MPRLLVLSGHRKKFFLLQNLVIRNCLTEELAFWSEEPFVRLIHYIVLVDLFVPKRWEFLTKTFNWVRKFIYLDLQGKITQIKLIIIYIWIWAFMFSKSNLVTIRQFFLTYDWLSIFNQSNVRKINLVMTRLLFGNESLYIEASEPKWINPNST